MTLIAIDIGHNCPPDTGANGCNHGEDYLTQEIGDRLIYDLEQAGYKTIRVTPHRASSVTNSLAKRCYTANGAGANYFVSIHFNASDSHQGRGTECYAVSSTGRELAKSIVDNIAELGFLNRGVKDGGRMYVVTHTKMPAVLVDCCFCDNSQDMELYHPNKMVKAIFNGIVGFLFDEKL